MQRSVNEVTMVLILLLTSIGHQNQASLDRSAPEVDLRCGAYCLYISMKSIGIPLERYEELEARLGQPGTMGYSMQQLAETATSFGGHVIALKTTLGNLSRRTDRFACIAHLPERNHFVCIYDIDDKSVYVADPPRSYAVDRNAFKNVWSGNALLIADHPLTEVSHSRYSLWITLLSIIAVPLIAVQIFRCRQRIPR
ncbi:cysteine peptidase family C39 domain-containing protein [Tautonia sociabilis]|uniref:Peptidase C39 domain-containing protein n=1 Tax=Tautonia sociabilis TaxID=2080755 RepID=A0A432MKW0_9BACT|nr:hypothetical protein TsocGM_10455 [Tautonia sociabilis]